MKNIVLICAAGMSTSLLVKRMEKAAAETGYECIEAIDVRIYGMVDGAKALEQAQKAMGQ